MPLEHGIGGPLQPDGHVLFAMNDGSHLVPCTITAAAHRHEIERAASDKYDCGQIDPDGGITLLPQDFIESPGASSVPPDAGAGPVVPKDGK